MVFGERSEATKSFRKGRKQSTSFSPGGRSFSSPIHERDQPSTATITLQIAGRRPLHSANRRGLHRRFLGHGTDHDSKPLPPLPGICLSPRPLHPGPQEYRDLGAAAPGFGRDLLSLPSAGARVRSTRRNGDSSSFPSGDSSSSSSTPCGA